MFKVRRSPADNLQPLTAFAQLQPTLHQELSKSLTGICQTLSFCSQRYRKNVVLKRGRCRPRSHQHNFQIIVVPAFALLVSTCIIHVSYMYHTFIRYLLDPRFYVDSTSGGEKIPSSHSHPVLLDLEGIETRVTQLIQHQMKERSGQDLPVWVPLGFMKNMWANMFLNWYELIWLYIYIYHSYIPCPSMWIDANPCHHYWKKPTAKSKQLDLQTEVWWENWTSAK